jgi:hypothetical protein
MQDKAGTFRLATYKSRTADSWNVLMARRSTTSAGNADRKFPVRIKIRVPSTGLGIMIVEIDVWLNKTFGPGGFGQSPASAMGMDATAFHFMTIDNAQAFLQAFPKIELAVGLEPPRSMPSGPYG